jgi:hypothetical protein
MNIYYIIIPLIIVVILIIIYLLLNKFDKFNNDNNIIYIGSEGMGSYGNSYINYLLKLIYPNKIIKYKNDSNVKLIIRSHF